MGIAGGGGGAVGPAGPAGADGADGPAGSANISGTANTLVKFTDTTTGGNSGVTDDGTTIGTTRSVTITKNALATTDAVGMTLTNTTASTGGTQEQYSPIFVLGGTSWTGSADEIQEIGLQLYGVDGRSRLRILRRAGGSGSWSQLALLDESNQTFGNDSVEAGGFVSSNFGFRGSHASASSGLKFGGSAGETQLYSGATTTGLRIETNIATGDTDPGAYVWCSAGTRSAGTLFAVGDGSGTFVAKAWIDHLGRLQAGFLVANDTSTTLNVVAADKGKLFTLSNAGAITVNLPAGAAGLWFAFKNKGAGAATLTPNGADKLFTAAQVSTLVLVTGDLKIVYWDGTDWSVQ